MLSDRCLSVLSVCDVAVLWPNGWMDQDKTWHAGCLGPSHIVLDGDPPVPLSVGKGAQQPPLSKFMGAGFACIRIIHDPCLLWPNGWMLQDAVWCRGRPLPGPNCVKWGPASQQKRGTAAPNFWPMSIVAKWLDGSR